MVGIGLGLDGVDSGLRAPSLSAKLLVSPPYDLGDILSALHGVPLDGNKTMTVLGQLSNLHDEKRAISYQSGEHYDETSDGRVIHNASTLARTTTSASRMEDLREETFVSFIFSLCAFCHDFNYNALS